MHAYKNDTQVYYLRTSPPNTGVYQNSKVSMYSGDLKSDHLKSGLFECPISNGRALAMAIATGSTTQKLDHSKSRWFVPISNGF